MSHRLSTFDHVLYLSLYEDIASAKQYTRSYALKHFIDIGKAQKRLTCIDDVNQDIIRRTAFSSKEYLRTHPQLAQFTEKQLFYHWIMTRDLEVNRVLQTAKKVDTLYNHNTKHKEQSITYKLQPKEFDDLFFINLYQDCMLLGIHTKTDAMGYYIANRCSRVCRLSDVTNELLNSCQFNYKHYMRQYNLQCTPNEAFRDWILRTRPWFHLFVGNNTQKWSILRRIFATSPSLRNDAINTNALVMPSINLPKQPSIKVDIVLVVYSTDITWIAQLLDVMNIQNLWIYVKNPDYLSEVKTQCTRFCLGSVSTNIHIQTIENVGSCDYAYIWHIVHSIHGTGNGKADVNLFLKDTTVVHASNQFRNSNDSNLSRFTQFLHQLQSPPKMSSSFETFFNVYGMGKADWKALCDFQLDDWAFTASSSAAKFEQSNVRPFGKWFHHNEYLCHYKDVVQNQGNTVPVSLGGLFAVTTSRILRVDIDVWKSLLQDIGTSVNNEQCHYVERTYAILFRMLPPLYKTTDVVIVSAHITGNVTTHEGSLQIASASRFCQDATETDFRWCPHLLYTDNDAVGERAKSIGWTVIAVTACKHFTSHKDTNLYAKRFKMKPHTLDEVRVHEPNTIVWMDSTRCLANQSSMLNIIDSFQMTSQLCIVGMQNFCGGGMHGDVHDEFYESIKHSVRYISEQHRFYEFIDANQKHLPHKDPQGIFLWCTNLIYNLRHPMCTKILEQWYNITVDTSIIQDQITMHFVHQQYRQYIGVSPVQLYRGAVHPQFQINTKRTLKEVGEIK